MMKKTTITLNLHFLKALMNLKRVNLGRRILDVAIEKM
jgi:hypothetical protein